MKRINILMILSLSLVMTMASFAAPVVRQGSGANAAAIQAIVDQFRADLGANNGVGGSFTSGRREINWDGVPDSSAEPNNLAPTFFNVNSPRGIVFNAIETDTGAALNQFAVSATTASGTAVRFGNINATYSSIFQTFSAQRLFIARNTPNLEITFFIPGTTIPATVSGFGLIFADVDSSTGGNRSLVRFYGPDGSQLPGAASAPVSNNGLSFVGVSFNAGERIARVVIECGNVGLSASNTDGTGGVDVVAMDDFIYGEPRAKEFHTADFDGDGTTDLSVFRPSNGGWFTLNSGSNTFTANFFGTAGDVPVDGDFDGDKRADLVVFRPSNGTWFRQNSSNGAFVQNQFGANGDKAVPGDYDKDGKTDIAVWRPNGGNYFILRSSDGGFSGTQWGANGDIPLAGGAQ